ncbi:putative disintegrin and metalloproteinase with thrombospondin motif [Trichinella spiralis]|uniref:Disintegrin and metalloproteinase with thrombospondin motif n=1 Tax=Trichinella spiralis TaxID=6334 RepID=A0ABR3KQX9_TRISP
MPEKFSFMKDSGTNASTTDYVFYGKTPEDNYPAPSKKNAALQMKDCFQKIINSIMLIVFTIFVTVVFRVLLKHYENQSFLQTLEILPDLSALCAQEGNSVCYYHPSIYPNTCKFTVCQSLYLILDNVTMDRLIVKRDSATFRIAVPDMTLCGREKWCMNGECVKAPSSLQHKMADRKGKWVPDPRCFIYKNVELKNAIHYYRFPKFTLTSDRETPIGPIPFGHVEDSWKSSLNPFIAAYQWSVCPSQPKRSDYMKDFCKTKFSQSFDAYALREEVCTFKCAEDGETYALPNGMTCFSKRHYHETMCFMGLCIEKFSRLDYLN